MTKCSAPIDPNSIVIPKKPANKSASEHRKITKPIMEKRRRARINHSLEQLKQILIENFHECSKKSSSLEKADILELTVKHLKDITAKRNQRAQPVTGGQQQLTNAQLAQGIHQRPAHGQQMNLHNSLSVLNSNNLVNRNNLANTLTAGQLNNNLVNKKGIQLMQSGFKDCKKQIYERLAQEDKQLSERVNSYLSKFEKQQFDQSKFNCEQVLNLSIHDHLLANSQQAGHLLLHTPSSACSSSSSNVFFPQNGSNSSGSLSPGSERSLSPSSDSMAVWRPW